MTDAPLIIEPSETATASVIWLHGLGADGSDFEEIVPQLKLPNVRFVFPHAPIRPVTINAHMPCRAWYDILSLSSFQNEDRDGIEASQKLTQELIAQENAKGIPTNKIVLAGFSQGGAMALHTGLHYPEKLAGILALSTYLPLAQDLDPEKNEANRNTPILQIHGSFDDILPLPIGKLCRKVLKSFNYPISFQEYPMGHQLCVDEIRLISEWLHKQLH